MSPFVACIGLIAFVALASATKFTDCGSETGQVASVQITDCPDSADTCVLDRGTSKDINIAFTAKTDTTQVKAVVHGVIHEVPLPFPVKKPDGCKTGLQCPLKNGQSYTYTNSIDIKKTYPALDDVKVRWELKDDQGKDLVCVEIPCQLK